MRYDIKGYKRSHKVILKFQNHLFLRYIIRITPDLLKIFKNVIIMKPQIFHSMKYDLKGHPKSYKTLFMQNFLAHSFMDQF